MKTKHILHIFFAALTVFQFSCSTDKSNESSSIDGGAGKGGSLARFALNGNNLYIVDNRQLLTYDVTNPATPTPSYIIPLGDGLETIFPKDTLLFIGTEFGMNIMSVANPVHPVVLSRYVHIRSCDPVVADDEYAYVTLSIDTRCQRGVNELQVVDIKNTRNPIQVTSYPMTKPQGLAIDKDRLIVCDNVLKLFDATDVKNMKLLQTIDVEGHDVIVNNGIVMVIGTEGLYQYSFQNDNLNYLSTIPVKK